MYNLYKKPISFIADRYEEWQGGCCISSGPIDTRIDAALDDNFIYFNISFTGGLRITPSFAFLLIASDELRDGRIQYVAEWDGESSVDPVICHVFINPDQTISCIRFAMTNPDRIIEFYGFQLPASQTDTANPFSRKSKAELKMLIEAIGNIQEQFTKIGEMTGNAMMAWQNNQVMEIYKNPLLMAWQEYQYGWHSDFWEEGHSMLGYMQFEINAEEILGKLLETLDENSPFARIERNLAITNGLRIVYKDLLNIITSSGLKHC